MFSACDAVVSVMVMPGKIRQPPMAWASQCQAAAQAQSRPENATMWGGGNKTSPGEPPPPPPPRESSSRPLSPRHPQNLSPGHLRPVIIKPVGRIFEISDSNPIRAKCGKCGRSLAPQTKQGSEEIPRSKMRKMRTRKLGKCGKCS